MRIPSKISYVFVSLAALLWGGTAAVAKLLLSGLDNLQLLFFSSLFAFLGLFLIVLFQKKQSLLRTYKKRDWYTFLWMGFCGTFLYNFFLFKGLELLPAQEAFIINYLWPVMVVIFAAFILQEKVTPKKFFAVICSFLGIVIVISKGSFEELRFGNLLGISSAFLGAVAWGFFSVWGKKKNYEPFTSMTAYYFFGTFFAFLAVVLFSSIPSLSLYQFAGLVWLGAFINGLAFVFWFLALRHGDTAKMSAIIFITPFLSLVYIHFLIGEKILVSSVIGLCIVVAGILLSSSKT